MGKYRNFYVWPKRKGEFFGSILAKEDFKSAINLECLENAFEVIEIAALNDLESQLDVEKEKVHRLREALEFYADKTSWQYEKMYKPDGTSFVGPFGSFVDHHSVITKVDLEDHRPETHCMKFGGKLAREVLNYLKNNL